MTKQSQIMKSATFLLFAAGFQGANFAPTVTVLIELHVCGWEHDCPCYRLACSTQIRGTWGSLLQWVSGSSWPDGKRGGLCRTLSCHFREGLWGMAGGHTASVQPDKSLPSLHPSVREASWFEWHLGLWRCFNIRDEIRDPAALPSSLRPPPSWLCSINLCFKIKVTRN